MLFINYYKYKEERRAWTEIMCRNRYKISPQTPLIPHPQEKDKHFFLGVFQF